MPGLAGRCARYYRVSELIVNERRIKTESKLFSGFLPVCLVSDERSIGTAGKVYKEGPLAHRADLCLRASCNNIKENRFFDENTHPDR